MKIMRFLLLIVIMIISLNTVSASAAVDCTDPADKNTAACGLTPSCATDASISGSSTCGDLGQDQSVSSNKLYGPDGVLTKVAGILAWIGGVASVVMIIIGGFTFVTGSSDPNTLSAAKKTVLYAVVGLVVMVLPSAVVRFVLSKL